MKKPLMSLAVLLLMGTTAAFAQENRKSLKAKEATTAANPADGMKFKQEVHDFGTVKEGDKAEFDFEFVNKSKEPIILQSVTASCGCTSPSWSKEPVKPGKKGTIRVAYSTPGRPGPINKSITVTSNLGTKVLQITGSVTPKPATSAPETKSVMKAN
ncbi:MULTISPECIES: DUF1573 domain-containing protein [Edaphocola]|jgi:hypothetical protein|uniref:DUF1573 domain-containing protein n=1 Tax=Edaphocola TaxID=2601681 RepID=UPI000F9A7988|nr:MULTISPECIES: DUF1573 domain-containing protein [Edaphocola]